MKNVSISRADVYDRVTSRIIADLERGIRPWLKPWNAGNAEGRITRPLRHNGTPYQGINILLLWGESAAKGYAANIWMTYKQAETLGAQVRKGEHGSLVVYANSLTKTETDETGQDVEREIHFLKGYTVFNAQQIDGLPERYYGKPAEPLPLQNRIAAADRFIGNTKAVIRHGGNQAFYSPASDSIQLPPFEAFRDTATSGLTGCPCPAGMSRRAALSNKSQNFDRRRDRYETDIRTTGTRFGHRGDLDRQRFRGTRNVTPIPSRGAQHEP
ncbi:MAG: DUF1738 domain-containing protein [Nitrospinae bacterium]|nr:DUF1738 domain-containing protein [Nitrospinota bacterium]